MRTVDVERKFGLVARAVEDARVVRAWRRLEGAGLHPILIKGWATARCYPNPADRWLGDLDLCFPEDELTPAIELRRHYPRDLANTDYHALVPDLPDRGWDEVFARTRLVPAERATIRVLAPEEHLRLTCRHLARHGACSRRMLEDVAALLGSLPEDFDWDECLRGDPCDTRWVLVVVGLAARLLGAEVRDPEVRRRATCPDWMAEVVPFIWSAGRERRPLGWYAVRPREGWTALRYRWLNPVKAAFHTRSLPRTRAGMTATVLDYFCRRRAASLVSRPLARLLRGGGRRRDEVHCELRA